MVGGERIVEDDPELLGEIGVVASLHAKSPRIEDRHFNRRRADQRS